MKSTLSDCRSFHGVWLCLLITLLIIFAPVTPALAVTKKHDVRYGSEPRHALDLYLVDGANEEPLVVFIHGGRWFRNDKSQVRLYQRVEKLTAAGFSVASINYRYSSEALWPAQRDDVMAALDFLRQRGNEFGFDVRRIALWGQSSGAHVALWAGLWSAVRTSDEIAAIVSWYAPTDLAMLSKDRAADDVPGGNDRFEGPSPESKLIGTEVRDNTSKADAASPLAFVQGLKRGQALPHVLLVHGTRDPVVSPLQSQRMYRALEDQGGAASVALRMVENGKHGGPEFLAEVDQAVAFLRRKLKRGKNE